MQSGTVREEYRRSTFKRTCIAAVLVVFASAGWADEQHGTQRIFRCEIQGKVTFGDQPCGAAPGTEIVLRPTNSFHIDAPNGESHRDSKPVAQDRRSVKQSESIAAEQQRELQRCQRMADQLVTIQSKLRAGYSAKQGEQLRERQRQLEQQRRTARCR
jgi:hypothetical protein